MGTLFMTHRATADISIREFQPVRPVVRANQTFSLSAVIVNRSDKAQRVTANLVLPLGVRQADPSLPLSRTVDIRDVDEVHLLWRVTALGAGPARLHLVASSTQDSATAIVSINVLMPLPKRNLSYIPTPVPAKTDVLVGAMDCPLWETDHPEMWANILKHPERTPALGFYAQENPEVADWETKWAVENGISYFVYCWYRDGQGGPVKQRFGSAIHQGLFQSKFRSKMKYAIMWENQERGHAGVSDEHDLLDNLFPFWMHNYFKDQGYLKVDNRPVLYIYRPELLVQDLGSIVNVKNALNEMRKRCVEAGFEGLYMLGEYRGLDPKAFELIRDLGLDAVFAYVLGGPDRGTPEEIIRAQIDYTRKAGALKIIPTIATASQAWSGWADEGPLWKLPPSGFEELLRREKAYVQSQPAGSLSSRMLLLDNWNEWGEGHYIAPYREYGFGYLDAVRRVFAPNSPQPENLLPEDIGMGPYDKAFREDLARQDSARRLASRKVTKPGGDEPGLIAWWSFDEPDGSPVAQDDSGHRLGATTYKNRKTPGVYGSALVCDGNSATVSSSPLLSPGPNDGLSLECWVKTSKDGQSNNWMINRVLSGGVSTGYRLGLVDDRPCFEVPQTDWSHHLTADISLPLDRWVHLVGTYNGKIMRIYLDGVEHGTLARTGPVRPNNFDLCIGNYTPGHAAYFHGLLDEVKIFKRALTPEEIVAHYARYAARAN